MPDDFCTHDHHDQPVTDRELHEEVARLYVALLTATERIVATMTDPISAALADEDAQITNLTTAVTNAGAELGSLVTLAQQLQGQLANNPDAQAIASQIEQRATALQAPLAQLQQATQDAQTAEPQADNGGGTTPPADNPPAPTA
jgi:uncharacterized protein involved in exopolysaccharide biosynthesis